MKKPLLCCCFKLIVFIKLIFTVAFLLIRKTWEDCPASKSGGWGILRNGGEGVDFELKEGWTMAFYNFETKQN